ncbi:MAG: type III secretion system chaperone [Deltaproteobacteria bacterium]|jgi:hypothetical protein|nr:type III secretion system chaperone [Deltaproteobacteria bacterium]
MAETITALLEHYGQALGGAPLSLDKDGHCALETDAGLLLNLFLPPDGDTLMILADLGPKPPEESAAEIYGTLLGGNFLAGTQREGVLTLEAESGRIALLFTWPAPGPGAEAKSEAFSLFMEAISLRGLAWRDRYAEMLQDESDPFGIWGQEDEAAPADELLAQGAIFP